MEEFWENPLRRTRPPPLLTLFGPELDRLLAAQLLAPLEQRRPLAITDLHELMTVSGHLRCPAFRAHHVVCPALAAAGEVSTRMQFTPAWWRNQWQVMQTLRLPIGARRMDSTNC